MRTRLAPLVLVAVLALALSAITTACDGDGDGELTLAEYFEKLDELDGDRDDRNAETEDTFDEDIAAAQSVEDALQASRDLFSGGLSALEDFVDGLDDLTPPAEAGDAHGKLVDAARNMLEYAGDVEERLDDAESAADMEAALTGEFRDATQEFEQACVDLAAMAEENGIETKLDCAG